MADGVDLAKNPDAIELGCGSIHLNETSLHTEHSWAVMGVANFFNHHGLDTGAAIQVP